MTFTTPTGPYGNQCIERASRSNATDVNFSFDPPSQPPSPDTSISADAPDADASIIFSRASSIVAVLDPAIVCACHDGVDAASVLDRRAMRGIALPRLSPSPQVGRSGCTTPSTTGRANALRCAAHGTYGLRSRRTLTAADVACDGVGRRGLGEDEKS